jgi:cobaltochelatase CobN
MSSVALMAVASGSRVPWASCSFAPTPAAAGVSKTVICLVPRELYQKEWERRRLRNRVHLTIGGCLGPCALANVVMVLFDGRQAWFHSMATDAQVVALYDWIEALVRAGEFLPPPAALAAYRFTGSTWEERA